MLGTDVLRAVTHQPFVVFTTAFGQHAVTAFEVGALDQVRTFRRVDGRLVAEMTDGTRLPVSRAKAQELRALGA